MAHFTFLKRDYVSTPRILQLQILYSSYTDYICCMNSYKTRGTRDRSTTHRLQIRLSTKSSISQLMFYFYFTNICIPPLRYGYNSVSAVDSFRPTGHVTETSTLKVDSNRRIFIFGIDISLIRKKLPPLPCSTLETVYDARRWVRGPANRTLRRRERPFDISVEYIGLLRCRFGSYCGTTRSCR